MILHHFISALAAVFISFAKTATCLRLIVEASQSAGDDLSSLQVALQNAFSEDNVSCSVRRQFISTVFSGFSLEIDNPPQDLQTVKERIESVPGVIAVWSAPTYRLSSISSSPAAAGRESEGHAVPDHNETSSHSSIPIPIETLPHSFTGVQQLHDAGINGQEVRIAMIDSGVDYLHPAFGAGLGPNYTVTYGVNLANVTEEATAAANMTGDPFSECTFHGTHTTGIVAGKHPALGFVGVAPGAHIEHYRISGCDKNMHVDIDAVIQAILAAHERNVDVISLSLETNGGPYPDEAVSTILTRIAAEDNIVIVVAMGNNGRQGPFSSDSPGSATGVLAVGSVNNHMVLQSQPRAQFSTSGESLPHDIPWSPGTPSRFPESLELAALSSNDSIDGEACHNISQHGASLRTSALLVRRGGCTFDQKMSHVVAATQVQYALIYDNEPTSAEKPIFEFDNEFPGIRGIGGVSADTGKELVDALRSGHEVSISMDSNFTLMPYIAAQNNDRPRGAVSPGSSWGPTGLLDIAPHIMAPGNGIWSTVPRSWGGYSTKSGTSQACPYVSGSVALLKQAHPELRASEILRRLKLSATPIRFNDGTEKAYNVLAPVWQQGHGLLNVSAAAALQTDAFPVSLPLNDTEHFRKTSHITIRNSGDFTAKYNITSISAATLAIYGRGNRSSIIPWHVANDTEGPRTSTFASRGFLDNILPMHAAITLQPETIEIPPHESRNISVVADITEFRSSRDRCPLYSGFINITSSRDESLIVSYGGLACNLEDVAPLPDPGTYLTAGNYSTIEVIGNNFKPVHADTLFKLPTANTSVPTLASKTIYPILNVELAMYSPRIKVYVLREDDATGSMENTEIQAYPADESTSQPGGMSRADSKHYLWRGQLADGSWAEPGKYTFEVCAARAWMAKMDCQRTLRFELQYQD
ncbi:unnamed protein product [Cercospora beticola]|nr:unnamed protein product [Cercospora beticola]